MLASLVKLRSVRAELRPTFSALAVAAVTLLVVVPASAQKSKPADPPATTEAAPAEPKTTDTKPDAKAEGEKKDKADKGEAKADGKEPAEDDPDKKKKKKKKALGATVSFRPGHGVTFATEDDAFSLNIRARLQLRDTLTYTSLEEEGHAWTNAIEPRRARVVLAGHVYSPEISYKLQLGLGTTETEQPGVSPLQDAHLTFSHLRDATLKVGQMLVPFDKARGVSSGEAQLVDRSIVVSELALARDVGVTVGSTELFGLEWLSYEAGVFGGEGRNAVPARLGFLYSGRIQVAPLGAFDDDAEGDLKRRAYPKFAFGVGAAYNMRSTRARSTGGGQLEAPFNYLHGAADLMFKWGGFSLLGEVLYRRATEREQLISVDPTTVVEQSRNGWGYLAQAGMMLTSQLEIAGRFAELYSFVNTPPTDLREIGGGASWYFEGHPFKVQADYFRVQLNAPAGSYHEARLQLQLSF